MLIQFPLVIIMKILFPFFNVGFVYFSFGLFILNVFTSNRDLIADMKSKFEGKPRKERKLQMNLETIHKATNDYLANIIKPR